jgi:hypothetical protein
MLGRRIDRPAHRVHGFGSAVTAATASWSLQAGAQYVVLTTDLSNPNSTRSTLASDSA